MKDTIKIIALAIAGAIIPVYAYICGAGSNIFDNSVTPTENPKTPDEEELASDTQ